MKLIRANDRAASYLDDIRRIVKALFETGYDCSDELAEALWKRRSDDSAAGWLILPEDVKQVLMEFLRCAGLCKSGKRCEYKARYGRFCGHHRTGK